MMAHEAARMAGCAFSVFTNSSYPVNRCRERITGGPSLMIFDNENFRISSARSRDCLASANVSTKSEIIPTRCVPCPGKKIAVFGREGAFYCQRGHPEGGAT